MITSPSQTTSQKQSGNSKPKAMLRSTLPIPRKTPTGSSTSTRRRPSRKSLRQKERQKREYEQFKQAPVVVEERNTHLEEMLCEQIAQLNKELHKEREWRDNVAFGYPGSSEQ